MPGGGQPRAAVGSLSMPLLATLEAAGLCHEHAGDVEAAAATARGGQRHPRPRRARTRAIPPRALARRLEKRLAVVYGAGPTAPVARRWKGQINENAKAPAFFNELPELDHNELMGWTSLPHVTSSTVALFLHDESGEERLARRAGAHGARVRGARRRPPSWSPRAAPRGSRGSSRWCSSATTRAATSPCSYGVDPTPVDAIQAFKASLAGDAG